MIRVHTVVDMDRQDEYLGPLVRLVPRLAARGVVLDPAGGDIVLADPATIPADGDDRPLVLFDRTDSAQLWWNFEPRTDVTRDWLASDRLLALLKMSRYSQLDYYNNPMTDENLHVVRIRNSSRGALGPDERPLRRPLDHRAYEKLVLSYGFWAFDAVTWQANTTVNLDVDRSIDVFCAGTMNYVCPAISWHRRQALHYLGEHKHRRVLIGRGRVFPQSTYHDLMLNSRICVSPWGWGETCYRDYEAILAGCVLIKPRTDFVECMLPLSEEHYVACEPDFSDLNDRVEDVLGNWHAYRERRQRAREYVLRANDEEWLADKWMQSFVTAIG